jgi:acyl-coenzyme A synthetase/AMP-(fatty) acid ligase
VLLENQYGPTETHVATRFTMTGDPAEYPLLPPIGQPIDGEAVYVLDEWLQPVPPGVKGEIFVGGAGLAQGYEGRPDLTKERFLDRPFGPEGELVYRTGDLGVALLSGEIICLGRADAQVKVRGFRVEPAEVELAITALAGEYPGIEGAAVVARHREGNDTFLAAFLLGDSAEVDLDDLKRRLRAKLPPYMVPSQFAWLSGFPLTPSGKRERETDPRTARQGTLRPSRSPQYFHQSFGTSKGTPRRGDRNPADAECRHDALYPGRGWRHRTF